MRFIIYLLIGFVFGITLIMSQAASWFRIYEMFRFESFHMYGIIGVAIFLGVLITQLMRKNILKSFYGRAIEIGAKKQSFYRYAIGGILFGLGWALVGACPGPMFTLLGAGYWNLIIVIAAALVGTYLYGLLRERLPH